MDGKFEPIYDRQYTFLYLLLNTRDENIENITELFNDPNNLIDINKSTFKNTAYMAVKNNTLISAIYRTQYDNVYNMNFNKIVTYSTGKKLSKSFKNLIKYINDMVLLPLLKQHRICKIKDISIPLIASTDSYELISFLGEVFNQINTLKFDTTTLSNVDIEMEVRYIISLWRKKLYDIYKISDFNNIIIPTSDSKSISLKSDRVLNIHQNPSIPKFAADNYDILKLLRQICIILDNIDNRLDTNIRLIYNLLYNIDKILYSYVIFNKQLNLSYSEFDFNKIIYNNLLNSYIHNKTYPFLVRLYNYVKHIKNNHIDNDDISLYDFINILSLLANIIKKIHSKSLLQ